MAATVVQSEQIRRALRKLNELKKKMGKMQNITVFGPYWRALGEFVHYFSMAEMQVTFVLRHLMRTDERVARVVVGGSQLDARCTYIKELLVVHREGRKTQEEMKFILKQLSIITKVRNDILHYGTGRFGFYELIISNAVVAKTSSRVREYAIDVPSLQKMTEDLRLIIMGLANVLYKPSERVSRRKRWEKALRGAWRYKSPPPVPPRRRSQLPLPTQLLRPRSSRASRKQPQDRG